MLTEGHDACACHRVQSYSSKDECSDYPSRFLRKLGVDADEELQMHDRVIDYVQVSRASGPLACRTSLVRNSLHLQHTVQYTLVLLCVLSR